jgi:hypothetical protein
LKRPLLEFVEGLHSEGKENIYKDIEKDKA